MKQLSLKVRDHVFKDVEIIIHAIHIPRNAYINDALSLYNQWNRRKLLKKQLHKESQSVEKNSLVVLHEYEQLADGLDE